MTKKVGFFGGTFDPPHFGHINLALSLKEQAGIEQVLVCPTSVSPLKESEVPNARAADRLEMVKKTFNGIPGFTVIEEEITSQEVVFTIDTIQKLLQQGEADEIALFLGIDHILLLPAWKEVEKLLTVTTPLFGGRPGYMPKIPENFSDEVKKRIENGIYSIPQFEISATEIRHRLAERLYCGHLMPSKVLDYIYEHSIYLSN